MKNILTIRYAALGLAAIATLAYSCTSDLDYSKTRTVPAHDNTVVIQGNASSNEKVLAKYDNLIKEYQEGNYFENWDYDPGTNNITISKKDNSGAFIEWFNHKLGLAFENHIAKENAKTLKFQAMSDFALMIEAGPYAKPLKVNGKPYSGVLVGTHLSSEQRILEVQFYEGVRIGTFNVWTNLNRLYTKSFKEKVEVLNVDVVRKPVIYLYPETTQDINVKVHFNGDFTTTFPKYNEATGWNVTAEPNGKITNKTTGRSYESLFWEGTSDFKYNLNEGFVIEGEKVADFLEASLETLGLDWRERTEFITYWLPFMEANPYNLIHFSTDEYTDQAPLEITPAPETVIRVFMVYKPLESKIDLPEQQLKKASRKGFTVVEWGGKKGSEVLN